MFSGQDSGTRGLILLPGQQWSGQLHLVFLKQLGKPKDCGFFNLDLIPVFMLEGQRRYTFAVRSKGGCRPRKACKKSFAWIYRRAGLGENASRRRILDRK